MNYEEITMKKMDPTKVKVGDLMAFMYYTTVKTVLNNGEALLVTDLDDENLRQISVQGKELVEKSFSADQYSEEVKENKTRVAEILVHSANRPLTVCFDKSDGEERTLRGRLVKPEPLLGRSMVEDLDVKGKNRLRQVDHRTLKWLIVDNVKYIVK